MAQQLAPVLADMEFSMSGVRDETNAVRDLLVDSETGALAVTAGIAGAPATSLADISGTVTTGGTAQNAAAANSARRGFWIQNNSSGDLWISTIATAVQSQPSLKIPPGAYYESPLGGAGTGAISIIGATTAQAFSGRQW